MSDRPDTPAVDSAQREPTASPPTASPPIASRPTGWRSGSPGLVLWAGTATVSGLGDSVQAFALSWEASGFGPAAAATVATLGILPRVLLMLLGGVAADRYGIRRVMIICDGCMIIVLGCAVGYLSAVPVSLAVIIAISMLAGAISAFYLPAAGGFLRLFVPTDQLPRVMARVSGLQQVARLIGPSLGAVLVIMVGLRGVSMINLVSFAAIMMVLSLVRPPISLRATDPGAAGQGADGTGGPPRGIRSVVADLATGVGQAARTPGMRAALGSLALVAGGVLPMLYLCLPLAVRERQWGVTAAGTIESCWIVGTLAVTLVVAKVGVHHRTGLMIVLGPLVAAVGVTLIAVAPTVPIAGVGAVLMGVGTAVYTGHLSPLFLVWTPPALTARFQSLFGIVQAAPMLVMNPFFGLAATAVNATAALAAAAVSCLAASAVALSSARLRTSDATVGTA
ncbi:MFS transporter [Microlunatus soli]|uniref:Major Facilitator Superfamily protein n=1 Tax=Microlunatus soli TaxID=630515 RepID=A0A1H1UVF0_9ACTN|nr:MFS transporter [Microlunatus soli]SDS76455.1 Major Facilitator Superfamily protein [Microlunatus soli]